MCGQTISLVKDIGDASNGSYSDPSFAAVEAAMAHVLMVENFHQFRTPASVVARQMVTPEHVKAVNLSGLRRSGPSSFVLPKRGSREYKKECCGHRRRTASLLRLTQSSATVGQNQRGDGALGCKGSQIAWNNTQTEARKKAKR